MKFAELTPPRKFKVGSQTVIEMKDCAHIQLEADEQVTFITEAGAEYDVARKSWGFYATPSLNGRLKHFGLRAVLVKSPGARYYLLLVEHGQEANFQSYLDGEGHSVVVWLDDDSTLEALEQMLKDSSRAD
jgi:hypothetical protein